MIEFFLCDIEGTTSSISFVHDVLFPYSYERMDSFIRKNLENSEVKKVLKSVSSPGHETDINFSIMELKKYIKEDRKHSGLKQIQGMIWKGGFESGDLKGDIYPDAYECLKKWKQSGVVLGIYSSGSVEAQKLLFKHSVYGDLSHLFSFHFDTQVGAKKEDQSYKNILKEINAGTMQLSGEETLFLSDVEDELLAATRAGFKAGLLDRDARLKSSIYPKYSDFHSIKV